MAKKVPRRLRRFEREGIEPPEEAYPGQGESSGIEIGQLSYERKESRSEKKKDMSSKEIATELALEEVQRFKEKHKRLPEKKEYDSISESIYAQLKDKERRKKAVERLERKKGRGTKGKGSEKEGEKGKERARHQRPGHGKEAIEESSAIGSEPKPGSLSEEEIKGMSVEDLFSSDKKGKSSGELETIGGDDFSLEGLEGMGEKPTAEKCPKCGAETKRVVFCPECGTAFCEKCAKKVEVLGNVKTFVCPGCGKKIKK